MRVLTLLRQVLDAEESVRIKDGAVDLDGRKLVLDTMDEYGLEQALRIREANTDANSVVEVIAVAVGPARCQDALRTALAIGADRAIHVETDQRLDVITVSKIMAEIAKQENADLIFSGGQQADWDSHALGAATAERLQWPQVTWTNALEVNDNTLTGKHDVDEGSETFTLSLPAVVTTQQGLNEPRYPTLPNIMKAKKKEMRKLSLDSFDIKIQVKFLGESVQVKERLNKMLDTKDTSAAASELIKLLRTEARVIA